MTEQERSKQILNKEWNEQKLGMNIKELNRKGISKIEKRQAKEEKE